VDHLDTAAPAIEAETVLAMLRSIREQVDDHTAVSVVDPEIRRIEQLVADHAS
jgi:hypothetical protein